MEIVARATFLYFFLLVLMRLLKKRALADMAPFEMLLLVSIGDVIQQGITQEDYSLTGAVLAVSTFAFWVTVFSYVTWRSKLAARVIEGVPLVLVRDGVVIEAATRVERLPLEEIMEAARQSGIERLEQIRYAILEPNGRISFIKAD